MKFNADAYDKLFPRQQEEVEEETMVELEEGEEEEGGDADGNE